MESGSFRDRGGKNVWNVRESLTSFRGWSRSDLRENSGPLLIPKVDDLSRFSPFGKPGDVCGTNNVAITLLPNEEIFAILVEFGTTLATSLNPTPDLCQMKTTRVLQQLDCHDDDCSATDVIPVQWVVECIAFFQSLPHDNLWTFPGHCEHWRNNCEDTAYKIVDVIPCKFHKILMG